MSVSAGAPGDDLRFMGPEAMWRLARVILQSWYAPMIRLRVYGADRVPPAGGAVVASNHISGTDPVVLGMASPRSIRYMAKIELWRVPVVRTLVPRTGTFPVDRGNPGREVIQNARAVLRSGHLLGIFVEGTRQSTDEIGAARTGAAMFAVLEGARIIPVCLIGTDHHRRNPFHRAALAWGTPIDVSGVPRGTKGYRAIAQAIEEELRGLREFLHAAQRAGYPRDAVPPVSRPIVEV
jgi:1-acyl-sn-glycerol-3-phosphate acyltransferase